MGQPRSNWLYQEFTVFLEEVTVFLLGIYWFLPRRFFYHSLVNINITRLITLGSKPVDFYAVVVVAVFELSL